MPNTAVSAGQTPGTPRVLVCAWDPLNPKSWSGTTFRIVDGLRERGLLVGTVDTRHYGSKPMRILANVVGRAWYPGTDIEAAHGRPLRAFRAARLHRQYEASGANAVLHIGNTYHLPLRRPTPGIRHYLYVDSAWEIWADRVFWKRNRITPRLFRDAVMLHKQTAAQMAHHFPIAEYVRDHLIAEDGVPPDRVTAAGTGRGGIQPLAGDKDYSQPLILFVAKDRFRDKGGRLVVDAFEIAQRQMPSLRLVVVGPKEEAERVKALPNAVFHDFLPWDALQNLFHTATLFALPADREPWGLVFLEALSAATPIVGMARNAVPEFTQDGRYGFQLHSHSPQDLADIFVRAHQDPIRLKAMGEGGRDYVLGRYSWDNTVDIIANQIRSDLARSSEAPSDSEEPPK